MFIYVRNIFIDDSYFSRIFIDDSYFSRIFINNYRLIHGLFHIALVISMRPWYRPRGMISVEGWWQGQYEKGHVLIYLSHILPGQITCYCLHKMLLPRRQITRRKLCFYYTYKFGIISIKYVIIVIFPVFSLMIVIFPIFSLIIVTFPVILCIKLTEKFVLYNTCTYSKICARRETCNDFFL